MQQYHRVLSIAGSDSGGGAGIQADIKTISACGCYAATAITAITVQNTLGVQSVMNIPADVVRAQVKAVIDDIGADAIKTGMLSSADIISAIAQELTPHRDIPMVIDPVMVSTSGHRLIDQSAITTLREQLLPIATIITPNIPEAEVLLGTTIDPSADLSDVARQLSSELRVSVLLKAGHAEGDVLTDVFYDHTTGTITRLSSPRIDTPNTHGTGCTLSSALASMIARHYPLTQAVTMAKEYINKAIAEGAAYTIGHGHGPVKHFVTM